MSDRSTLTPLGTVLPDGWSLRKLGPMCSKIGSGATPRGGAAVYSATGVAFIRSQNVFDHRFSRIGLVFIDESEAQKLSSVAVQPKDVLLNITGDGDTIARCCVVPDDVLPARVNQHVMIIRPSAGLLAGYLQCYLSHPSIREYMLNHNSGGSRRALTKGHAETFAIVVPPLHEQRAIAELAGAVGDKIAINDRIAATCQQLATALYSDELNTGTSPLSSLCKLRKEQIAPSQVGTSTVAHYSLPAFDRGQVPEIVDPNTILSAKFAVTSPSVLVSKLNPEIPRVWRVRPDGDIQCVASTEYLVLEPIEGVDTAEIRAVAMQESFLSHIVSLASGTSKSHQRVSPTEVMAASVVDPRKIRAEMRRHVVALTNRADSARSENTSLVALRATLLAKLISGELRVKDAESQVSAAV